MRYEAFLLRPNIKMSFLAPIELNMTSDGFRNFLQFDLHYGYSISSHPHAPMRIPRQHGSGGVGKQRSSLLPEGRRDTEWRGEGNSLRPTGRQDTSLSTSLSESTGSPSLTATILSAHSPQTIGSPDSDSQRIMMPAVSSETSKIFSQVLHERVIIVGFLQSDIHIRVDRLCIGPDVPSMGDQIFKVSRGRCFVPGKRINR